MRKRVLSGIRATGRLHLGNYLGAVKGMLALQADARYETLYMIADLHSMTTPYEPGTLQRTTREVMLDYLACGLDPEKSVVFVQSDLSDLHTQLAFYLSTAVSVARMQHLPTYKDKVKQYPGNVTMALLNYPVLMAADILIYKASKVPVGIDQEPHLEVAREIARKMNSEYGTDFPEPTRFATAGEYVPSLTGEGKMSKTIKGSFIELTDTLETIRKRLAATPTDSGKGEALPKAGGVASLLALVELFEGKGRRADYERQYLASGVRYQELKEELAQTVFRELATIQEKRRALERDPQTLERLIRAGADQARRMASETVALVRTKMGLS